MKHLVIESFGGPEKLVLRELTDPVPGKGQVRVHVHAAGINFADILARKGLYPDAPPRPMVVGYEVSGIVDAVGEGVDDSLLGREVIALTRFNGYSSKVLCTPEGVFPKPAALSFEEAAGLPVTTLTAWQLIVVMGSLSADETILIHNAGGGVGLAAIQIAKHIGARIVGTASAGKHERLRAHGVAEVFEYENWPEKLSDFTNGRGVELILDPIGGKNWKKSYAALRKTGRLGFFGISTVTNSSLMGPLRYLSLLRGLPFFTPIGLMNANRSTFGVNLGHLWNEQAKIANWANQILAGVDEGWIKPHIDRSFDFEHAADAHAYIEDRKNFGKVVLTP